MRFPSPIHYRRTTELAADAMINEGGAVQQPSWADAGARVGHRGHHGFRNWQRMLTPATAFWAGFAAGFVACLLDRKLRGSSL